MEWIISYPNNMGKVSANKMGYVGNHISRNKTITT
jgi:hypothetical protein